MALLLTVSACTGSTSTSSKTSTLTLTMTSSMAHLDPDIDNSRILDSAILSLYDTLFQQDFAGNIQPDLALGDQVSSDGLTHTLKLRTDVKFHDGSTFTSADVKFSLDRRRGLETLKTGTNGFYLYAIDSVDVSGPDGIIIHLKQPDGTLDNELAYLGGVVVPMTYIQRVGDVQFNLHPIGSGPYEFVSQIPGTELRIKAFSGYWNNPLMKAHVQNLVLKTVTDQASALAQLRAGQVDFVSVVLPSQVQSLKSDGFTVQSMPSDNMLLAQFNQKSFPEFRDPRVGQAFNYAIDRAAIVKAVYSPISLTLIDALDPPERPWYDKSIQPYPYDPQKAKQLLQEAKFDFNKPIGFEVAIGDGFIGQDDAAQAIASQLNAIGLHVTVKLLEGTAVDQDSAAGRLPQLAFTNVPNPFQDPVTPMSAVTICSSPYSQMCNPALDRQIKALGGLSGSARVQGLSSLDKTVHENPPGVFLWMLPFISAMKSNVTWKQSYYNEWFLPADLSVS
jgi:peptide/nickel transport system substrate-binding protein